MNKNRRLIILIFMTLIGLSSMAIILFVSVMYEIKLSIGALIVAVFWFIWFKKTGWYLLSEKLRAKILKNIPFYL